MGKYILRRVLYMIPVLLAVSILSFVIIQLPPGDYLTTKIAELKLQMGTDAIEAEIASLRRQYGLDLPLHERYLKWMWGLIRGDLGRSFHYNRPVNSLIGERLALTVTISLFAVILHWLIAFPVGIYSATHQYSFFDYLWTFLGFIGISVPAFLLALLLMFSIYRVSGVMITGLFSTEYAVAPWSLGKVLDLLRHVWLPAVIVGVSGTAGLIRVLRGQLLDELRKQYVITARAKGLSERRLIFKYPVRLAINPMISTIGWLLPGLISGETIVSIVLNLPTSGPMLLDALRMQDMYLAGSFIMLLSTLTVIGTLISDILLAWSDPRIRYD
ncbi:MAG: ABC transporter permease [Planctomycetota bacterium]